MEILRFEHITKEFPGVRALDDVTFSVEKGTIHALLGENGAGKSTLIKIASGVYTQKSGTVYFDGKAVKMDSPADAKRIGVSVVHQEIKLVETLTIAENIFMGKLFAKKGIVEWSKVREQAKAILDDLGIEMDITREVSDLSVSEQQIVEICKALTDQAQLIIMDEPSATLTDKELRVLFETMRRLKEKGITIIYISHRLDEIFEVCDSFTVLRDGKVVGGKAVSQIDRHDLIKMMVGREIVNEYPKTTVPIGETVLKVSGLTQGKRLKDVGFTLKQGEIVGLSGLVGSGRTELVRAILGVDDWDEGTVEVRGKMVAYSQFSQAMRDGFGFVTEDRKKQGLVLPLSIEKNITLAALSKISKRGVISQKREHEQTVEFVNKLNIAAPSTQTPALSLSGGNQQKVVIAKWLMQDAEIFVIDEPTRGIDVGAKSEIYKILSALVAEGKSVLMISSEMPELIGMCDRIYVMHEGRMKGVVERSAFTQQKIMEVALA